MAEVPPAAKHKKLATLILELEQLLLYLQLLTSTEELDTMILKNHKSKLYHK